MKRFLALMLSSFAIAAASPPAAEAAPRQAPHLANPARAPILGATMAGARIVAVGDYGAIILSDDGQSFRQSQVPTRAPLTSVFFLDARRGWAAGHDGTILATSDGGETWRLQREEPGKERVLLSIWFENAEHGLAVGQFGLALETTDGGNTWQERRLVEGDAGEIHLQSIVDGRNGLLLIAAEGGFVLRSEDAGKTWQAIPTSNKGSFWTGLALSDGSLLIAGLRGHIFRSQDRGRSWQEVPSGTQQSLTTAWQAQDGTVRLLGLSGVTLTSRDQGRTFEASLRPDRTSFTSAVMTPTGEIDFSILGVVDRH